MCNNIEFFYNLKKLVCCVTRGRLYLLLLLLMLCPLSVAQAAYRYRFEMADAEFDKIARQMDSLDYYRQLNITSLPLLHKLDSIAQMRNTKLLRARAIYWDVKCHQYLVDSDSSILKLRQAATLVDVASYDAARIHYQLAGNLQRTDQLAAAWQELEEHVTPILREVGDSLALGNAYHLYAFIYQEIGDVEEAIKSLDMAQRCLEAENYPLGKIFFMRALMEEDPETSLNLYQQAIAEAPEDITIVAQAYTNLASNAVETGNYEEGRKYIDQGLQAIDTYQSDNNLLRSFLLVNLSQLDYQEGRYQEVLSTLKQVEQLSGDFMKMGRSAAIYMYFSNVYDKLGKTDEAYRYLKDYVILERQQRAQVEESKAQRQRDLETIHLRQQEIIDELTQQARQEKLRYWSMAGVLLLLVITTITMILLHNRKVRRRHEAENRELRDVLQQETVNTLLTQNIKDEAERNKAEVQMEQVRPGFFAKLKEINPDLTDSDLRLCTYISIGMRAKEIAQYLSVTPDSVNTARYRLRKKLNLQSGEKLDDFLRNL